MLTGNLDSLARPALSLVQKTRRRTYRAHGRINPYQGHPCHVEVILSSPGAEVPRAKDLDGDVVMSEESAKSKKGKGKKVAQIEA